MGGKEACVGATEHHGHAESLRRADHGVGPKGPRSSDHGQGEEIGGDRDEGSAGLEFTYEFPVVTDPAAGARILKEHSVGIPLLPGRFQDLRRRS